MTLGTPAYRRANKDRGIWLGSSDAPIVVGLSPYKSAMTLYHEKLGLVDKDETERAVMSWGHILEEPVAQEYAKVKGRHIRRPSRLSKHPRLEWMLASIDRFDEEGVVEVAADAFQVAPHLLPRRGGRALAATAAGEEQCDPRPVESHRPDIFLLPEEHEPSRRVDLQGSLHVVIRPRRRPRRRLDDHAIGEHKGRQEADAKLGDRREVLIPGAEVGADALELHGVVVRASDLQEPALEDLPVHARPGVRDR